jgi:hypothetical protein
MKLRFSIRTMLVLVAAIGFVAFWQSRPAQVADRFVAAIEAGDYAAADGMFRRRQQHRFAEWMKKSYRMEITARREPPTLLDWFKGVSRVTVVIDDYSGWDYYATGATIEVTRRGVQDAHWTVESIQRGPGLLPQVMGAVRQ